MKLFNFEDELRSFFIIFEILNSAMLQMNCVSGHLTVEAQWPVLVMKTKLTGMYGFCPH